MTQNLVHCGEIEKMYQISTSLSDVEKKVYQISTSLSDVEFLVLAKNMTIVDLPYTLILFLG